MAPSNEPLLAIMEEPLDLEPFFPDRFATEPLGVQLARRLRTAIESGSLPAGTKMLGSRQLAKRLGIGRNTVTIAFEQLTAEGYFETRVGNGTFVAASTKPHVPRRTASSRAQPKRALHIASLSSHFESAAGLGPLRPGMPDLARFPLRAWKSAARRTLTVYEGDRGYGPAQGTRPLREAIATHVRQFRGVATDAENVIVVEGAQAALHLAAFLLSTPGDVAVVEDPCYALARAAFEAYGLHLHGVNVDDDGIVVEHLPKSATFAFVTPSHQFPLGGVLPLSRRVALLDWARASNAYIIEDDYDSEFTSHARPLPALQSLDRDERVIYIGSFSKTLAPAARLGYIISPPHLAKAFRAARASTSLGVALHLQATAADFINAGHLARHIHRMNRIYERRRDVLMRTLAPSRGSSFRLGPSETGLHVAFIGPPDFDDIKTSRLADGQRLVSLSRLCIRRHDCRGFVLGFTSQTEEAVARAAAQVGEAFL